MEALTASPATHDLPRPLTSFIGREQELRVVQDLLQTARLLTLVGAGGVGKTRLALAVATAASASFVHGAALVELAVVADPSMVPVTVARALGQPDQARRSALDGLLAMLRTWDLLLVLDNCEHLAEAVADVAERLLMACPSLRILATSREPLAVPGEMIWRVPSLSVPSPQYGTERRSRVASALRPLETPPSGEADAYLDAVVRSEAGRLFMDRARTVRPDLSLTADNAGFVDQICRRLDGIPLAIELAATRLGVLALHEIAARLDDRFALLAGNSRSALPHHQTLRATIDWSHALLTPDEQVFFRRLSVFAGGWTLEAVGRVTGYEHRALDTLSRLVDRSLVLVDAVDPASSQPGAAPAATRYRMLETIAQYGAECLQQAGDKTEVRVRHLSWALDLAHEAEPHLRGAAQRSRLDRLAAEHDNLRAALGWALAEDASAPPTVLAERRLDALRMANALAWFWWIHGHFGEGQRWLERLLTATEIGASVVNTETDLVRAQGFTLAGILAFPRADFGQSIELLDQGLALSRQHQDTPGIALALGGLGRVAQYQGRWEDAERFHAESLPLFEQTGDRWGVGWSLEMSGRLALSNGDYDLATRLCEESLRIGQTMGDRRNVALALRDLARAAYARRDYARTEALSQQGLEQAQSLGFRRSIAWALHMLGLAAHQRRDPARALDLLCESLDLRELLDDQEGVAECLEAIATAWLGRHALTAEGTDRDAARRAPGGRRSLDRQSALHAARLLAAAERLRETIGTPLSPAERLVWLPNRDRIRTTLSEQELLDAHVAGAQLSSEQAVEEALTVRPQVEQARMSGPLSRREEEVAILVARGLTNRKIAERLVIGERTVATHIEHILNKLGFRSRAQVAAWATDARSSDAE